MNGIYFKEGIYVAIDDGKSRNDICVYNYHKDNVSLYGGRIRITYSSEEEAKLYVDGISIIKIRDKIIESNEERKSLDIDRPLYAIYSFFKSEGIESIEIVKNIYSGLEKLLVI